MNAVLALTTGPLRAPRRGGRFAPTPSALSVLAFAVTTAFGLSVVGGLLGFMGRAANPSSVACVTTNGPHLPYMNW